MPERYNPHSENGQTDDDYDKEFGSGNHGVNILFTRLYKIIEEKHQKCIMDKKNNTLFITFSYKYMYKSKHINDKIKFPMCFFCAAQIWIVNYQEDPVPSQMSIAGDEISPSPTSSASRHLPFFIKFITHLQVSYVKYNNVFVYLVHFFSLIQ